MFSGYSEKALVLKLRRGYFYDHRDRKVANRLTRELILTIRAAIKLDRLRAMADGELVL